MSTITKPLEQILQKEMSRKEFLTTLGLGMASIMGFSTIIHLLTGKSVHSHLGQRVGSGYGRSAYGRSKDSKINV